MKCRYCSEETLIKKGVRNNIQRFKCKSCNKYQQKYYQYKLFRKKDRKLIIQLLSVGVGISGISAVTGYSKATICRKIKDFAYGLKVPNYYEYNQVYEVDEMWSFIKKKNPENFVWITYALNRNTKQVMSLSIGSKTKNEISPVIEKLKVMCPKKIVTDKYNVYPDLVKPVPHDNQKHQNNRIERANLTLRQHLKRLSRKTLSFSKSIEMLEAIILLYLYWNGWRIGNK